MTEHELRVNLWNIHNNNKKGISLKLPVNIYKKEWMVVFFRPPEPHDESYLIYDFIIK